MRATKPKYGKQHIEIRKIDSEEEKEQEQILKRLNKTKATKGNKIVYPEDY